MPTSITANDVLEHHDVATKIGLLGIVNPGLFLKSKKDSLFDSNECPCDALFAVLDGKIERLGTGMWGWGCECWYVGVGV